MTASGRLCFPCKPRASGSLQSEREWLPQGVAIIVAALAREPPQPVDDHAQQGSHGTANVVACGKQSPADHSQYKGDERCRRTKLHASDRTRPQRLRCPRPSPNARDSLSSQGEQRRSSHRVAAYLPDPRSIHSPTRQPAAPRMPSSHTAATTKTTTATTMMIRSRQLCRSNGVPRSGPESLVRRLGKLQPSETQPGRFGPACGGSRTRRNKAANTSASTPATIHTHHSLPAIPAAHSVLAQRQRAFRPKRSAAGALGEGELGVCAFAGRIRTGDPAEP
jgi:hypothetical protein